MVGPIDYIVVGFKGNNFDGSILRELGESVDKAIIRVIGLGLVKKDVDGVIQSIQLADLGDKTVVDFQEKYIPENDKIASEDIDEIAELLEPNTAAGMLVIEHLWAKPLKQAIINANGTLIAEGRIHPEAIEELNSLV